MNAKWGDQTRIQAAKDLLAKTVEDLRDVPNLELGLRVYGHQTPITPTFQDCNDTKLEIPFAKENHSAIKTKIRTIQAKGTTPIAMSLLAAADDFPDKNARNVIILITDGLEACPNDPCVIARELKEKGINVTPFVIGLGMDLSYLEKFSCIGSFSEAETKESFEKVLQNVVNKAILNTTVQINLNDIYDKPTETNVTMFLYEAGTGNLKYTYVHTLDHYGNPDTLILDHQIKYDLVVNTIPSLEKKNIEIIRGKHNIIELDAPQGYIKVRFTNADRPYQIQARVMQSGKPQTINLQQMDVPDKYIVGNYDLEIMTTPRIYVSTQVEQSSTSYIDIAAPGMLKYTSGNGVVAQVFLEQANGRWMWVCNLPDNTKAGTQQLQPGTYRIVYRQKNHRRSEYTNEKDFRINSNKTSSVQL